MSGYDIIGDVHGHAAKLEDRLHGLGYAIDADTGAYRHPQRRAVFVGDLIDRGPDQLRVLEIVKAMVDAGNAQIVMGNHEFNAISYATEHPGRPGEYLRERSKKNQDQHKEFLTQLTEDEQRYYIEWFWMLPLWLDLGEIRIVHACWHEPSMQVLGSDRLTGVDQLVAANTKDDPVYRAVENLLKGPEISLTDHGQPPYLDKGNHPRENARIRWWDDGATTLRELAVLDGNFTTEDGQPYPELPAVSVGERERSFVYNDRVPVFYGHYWRQDTPVHRDDWTEYTACVDFSAGNGGTLVAYRTGRTWSNKPRRTDTCAGRRVVTCDTPTRFG